MPLLPKRRGRKISRIGRTLKSQRPQLETLEDRIVLSYSAAVIADNPVAYYQFEETSGTTANNLGSLGDAADGTISGGPTLGAPSLPGLGNAFNFTNGVLQEVVLIEASTLGIQNGSFTASAWVQRNESGTGDRIVFGSTTAAANQGLHLTVRDSRTHFGFYANDMAGPTQPDLVAGEWHHIAFTYDLASQTQTIFLDGQQIAQEGGHGPFLGNDVVRIASAFNSAATTFGGIVDEVAIFNTALTPAQIQTHFQAALNAEGINDDALTTHENTAISAAAPGITANDVLQFINPSTGVQVSPNPLVVLNVDTTGTAGAVTVDSTGAYNYDPSGAFDELAVGETATDTFTYSTLELTPGAPLSRMVILANTGPGGTWNAYMRNPTALTWDAARAAAEEASFMGIAGHMISIASAEENNLARSLAHGGDAWIGLTDSDQVSGIDGQMMPGTEAGNDPNGGWAWVDGTPFTFQNFAAGEPNDSGGEDATQLRADGLWNDHRAGGTLGQADHLLQSVIEFELGLASPADFENQVASGFVVTAYQHDGGVGTLAQADDFLANPTGVSAGFPVTALSGTVNFHNSGGAGHFTADQAPVPGVLAGDQSNYVIEANSTIYIPAAGDYTFGVNSDDGFGLSIAGAELLAVHGQNDNSSTLGPDGRLTYAIGRGTADTLGVFNFPAPGFYDLNLVHWEATGGSTVELFAAPGTHTAHNASFQLVGGAGGVASMTQAPTAADATDTTTVTVTVIGDYDQPEINDDDFTTDEETVLNGNVYANDDPINAGGAVVGPHQQVLTTAQGLSVTINADGSFSYDGTAMFQSLGAGETASDSFVYVAASDQGGLSVPPFVLAPTGPGGTWNAYTVVTEAKSWDQARVDAATISLHGVEGHLATISSAPENSVLHALTATAGSSAWIGITDATGVSALDGFDFAAELGTFEAGSNPVDGWVWITGEPVTYTQWSGGEPNNSGEEDVAELRLDNGSWNDNNGGTTIIGGSQTHITRGSLVEFELNLPSPEFLTPGFFNTLADVASGPSNVAQAEAAIANNAVGAGYTSTVNFNNNDNGTDFGFFPGDDPVLGMPNGADTYAIESTGHVYIPAAGDYTFGVNSDDGFLLEITGGSFVSGTNTNSGGDAALNVVGGDNVAFNNVRGAGTPTLGVFNFSAAGYYPIRMLFWENGGGANAELFATAGAETTMVPSMAVVGDTANGGLLVVSDLAMATVNITIEGVNDVPENVSAGGPYVIAEGDDLTLSGSATDIDVIDTLTYSWDINGDGDFSDASGANPTLAWSDLQALAPTVDDGPQMLDVTLRVNDGSVDVDAATTLTLNNAAPTAAVSGPADSIPQQDVTFTVTADDASNADDAAGFTFEIDFDGDGTIDASTATAAASADFTTQYGSLGAYTVRVFATDKDGGTSLVATTEIDIVPVAMIGDDIFAGGTDGASDRIIFFPTLDGMRVRYNNTTYPTEGSFEVNANTRLIALGGGGSDRMIVTGADLPAMFDGGAGNDYLAGGTQDDELIGGAGNDILLGGEGNNVLIGDDREGVAVAGSDRLEGRSGNDTLFGGGSNDRLTGGAGDDILDGGTDNDFVFGGEGNDLMVGREGIDVMQGHYGNDVILGGDAADQLYGGAGSDLLLGGVSSDRVRGDGDDDLVSGNTSDLDADVEAALAAMLATMGTTLADADAAVAAAVDAWFNSGMAAGFGALTEDGATDDLTGDSGVDTFHSASDFIRDLRDGETTI